MSLLLTILFLPLFWPADIFSQYYGIVEFLKTMLLFPCLIIRFCLSMM
uniref:Uncharacterized protein n=1 Tax=Rhizophora mucronata TaxID=61149 RepID=A0A2P2P3T6_RHIMU